MAEIELIVRAIIVRNDKILLCKNIKGEGYYFLPGGHIENSESPETALERELFEEIGRNPKKVKKVVKVDNTYTHDDETIIETFYIYLVALDNYKNIKSKEDHLLFDWIPVNDLERVDFKPRQAIKDILTGIEVNKYFWKS